MSEHTNDIQSYIDTHQQLITAIEGLTEEQLTWKETPEKWSVTEVLSHLADHNIVVSFRIREILSGSTVQLPAFSQDPWVSSARANEGAASDILDVFQALLTFNSLLFKRLPTQDWEKSGINFKGQVVKLTDVVQSFTAHVQVHLAQIERIKNASKVKA
ncbi:DinB family protein [Paenibacillus sp. N3.4]|uniref:DinB family protein n=1 Tax=Paenibacillus sp. N3.4 TaxID=2603222 RepID=UPI0011C82A6E|nr:DinB family protein [Paenibacillus sp. N3.4]TXK84806.1 DinB family protein [Paenibacillus sp. N3.4]